MEGFCDKLIGQRREGRETHPPPHRPPYVFFFPFSKQEEVGAKKRQNHVENFCCMHRVEVLNMGTRWRGDAEFVPSGIVEYGYHV